MSNGPSEETELFRPTLNQHGWMLTRPDAMMRESAQFSSSSRLLVVDVGATFAVAILLV